MCISPNIAILRTDNTSYMYSTGGTLFSAGMVPEKLFSCEYIYIVGPYVDMW
jgi:hypothetical protein